LGEAPPFGRALAQLRKARGLTQPQLAERVGVSLPMLIYYERRAKNPSAAFVRRAAEVLAVSVDELLGHRPLRHVKPGPTPRLQKIMEQISQLPRSEQKFVTEFLETIVRRAQK
jgi:transcriptional regulator with XRE-family HTH domain